MKDHLHYQRMQNIENAPSQVSFIHQEQDTEMN